MDSENNLNRNDQFLHHLHSIVLDNLGNESFSVEDLARSYGISRSQLHRKLKKLKNQSISRFIREIRLDESYKMLQNDEGTVSEIAYKVGFSTPTYFNTCFRAYFGFPPGEAKLRSVDDKLSPAAEQSPNRPSKTSRWKQSKMAWVLGVGITAVLVYLILFYSDKKENRPVVSELRGSEEISIAVLPFQNLSPDNNDLFYCNGIMQNVIDNLSKIPEFRVLPSRTTNLYKDTKLLPTELGEELGVHYIIDGTFQKINSQIQVTLALTSTDNGRQIWTNENVTFSLPELFSMQAQIANQVANQLKTDLTVALNRALETIPTRDELAYEYYLMGQEKLRNINYRTNTNRAYSISLNEAQLLFNLAIERDTNFASAYLGLARTEYLDNEKYYDNFLKDSALRQFEKLVNTALHLDPELSEGYFLKGKYSLEALNLPLDAEKNWQKALDINPNNLDALYALTDLYMDYKIDIIESIRLLKEIEYRTVDEEELYEIYLRLSQAYSKLMDLKMEWFYLEKCNKINDSAADLAMPWYYLRSGQPEKALEELTRRFPNKDNQFQLVLHGLYLSQNGQYREAVRHYEQWEKLVEVQTEDNWFSTNDWHRYGQALVKIGEDSLGVSMIRKQISFIKQRIKLRGEGNLYDLVGSYAFLNELDSAYYYLEHFYEQGGLIRGWGNASFILVDFQFDNIRSKKRFMDKFEEQKIRLGEIRKMASSVDPNVRMVY